MSLKKIILASVLSPSFCVIAVATSTSTVDNQDGTFTYTQRINKQSTAPHYLAPQNYGFDFYSHYSQDYGWQHSFENLEDPLLKIQSATLLIRGYDIDSESFHGTSGEYDGISVDGSELNPGLLQGTNGTWSETSFDVPLSAITDDGLVNVFLDIDMNHDYVKWKTTLDYSELVITYAITPNDSPYLPVLTVENESCLSPDKDLVIVVDNTENADPDGDSVTYQYRWFVDVGQGEVVDDEIVGKTDHSGSTVLASQVQGGEIWRVQVTAIDSNGLISNPAFYTWEVSADTDSDCDGISNIDDDYPNDPQRASNNYTVKSTLAFEDLWPNKGDYDLNDFVMGYTFNVIKNADNQVKQIDLTGSINARGASNANAFALAFDNISNESVQSASIDIAGNTRSLVAEAGHTNQLVYTLVENIHDVTASANGYQFFNTQSGDESDVVPVTMSIIFNDTVNTSDIGNAPFNPFIYPVNDRGREVHLPNHSPTALANADLFKTGDDNSEVGGAQTYMTTDGHPWALDVTSVWSHPIENVDIVNAYPMIKEWAESKKGKNTTWYNEPVKGKCWKCN